MLGRHIGSIVTGSGRTAISPRRCAGTDRLTPTPGRARKMDGSQEPSMTQTPHDAVGNDSSNHGHNEADHDLRYPVFHEGYPLYLK
jgi:hypothetical protein